MDYTTEDVINVTEKAMKATKPKTINHCRKLCPDVMHDFTGFMTRVNQGNHERGCGYGQKKKKGRKVKDFSIWTWRHSRENRRINRR